MTGRPKWVNLLPQHKRKSKLSLALLDQSWLQQSPSCVSPFVANPGPEKVSVRRLHPILIFLTSFLPDFFRQQNNEGRRRHGVRTQINFHFKPESNGPRITAQRSDTQQGISNLQLASHPFPMATWAGFGPILGPIFGTNILFYRHPVLPAAAVLRVCVLPLPSLGPQDKEKAVEEGKKENPLSLLPSFPPSLLPKYSAQFTAFIGPLIAAWQRQRREREREP